MEQRPMKGLGCTCDPADDEPHADYCPIAKAAAEPVYYRGTTDPEALIRLREGPGVGFHVEPERIPALDVAEDEAQKLSRETWHLAPGHIGSMIEYTCTCTGLETPDGDQHQIGCPRYVQPEDPFSSNRIDTMTRTLVLEQAKARENIARSAVTYVLDEMGRAIDTIRHSVLEQPEKLIESRNQRRAAIRKDIEHVFALSGEDAESHQRLISNLVATLIWNGWTKSEGGVR